MPSLGRGVLRQMQRAFWTVRQLPRQILSARTHVDERGCKKTHFPMSQKPVAYLRLAEAQKNLTLVKYATTSVGKSGSLQGLRWSQKNDVDPVNAQFEQ